MAQARSGKRTATKPAKGATGATTESGTKSKPAAPTKLSTKPSTKPATKPTTKAATRATTKPSRPTTTNTAEATRPEPKTRAATKSTDAKRNPPASTASRNGASNAAGNTKAGAARKASLAWEADGGYDTKIGLDTAPNGAGISLLDQEDKARARKPKLVRDSFTMPEDEYRLLGEIKKNCLRDGFNAKKSELLRIGVALVRDLSTAELKKKLGDLVPLKTGRPKKEK
jgi:hypothetical protein